ncbi:hypothetical protein [Streptomyces venezuelae]|uniref:hypothetical protein n=1 Tax=Streptomyces venezuelae TaxID=54571 RepID=UPI00278C52A0|nr:hypothetical protein [Streptomyces venezuelae]
MNAAPFDAEGAENAADSTGSTGSTGTAGTAGTAGDLDGGREVVARALGEVRELVGGFGADDLASGAWFGTLATHALTTYAETADWRYFEEKYEGVPVDAVVDRRIKLAVWYAGLAGGISAGAYSMAVAAAVGPRGGAGAAAKVRGAGALTGMVDLAYLTRLQLRLVHDIAVLHRIPIDPSDPEDLRKLLRVALFVKGTELTAAPLTKYVPTLVRPVVKRYYSGPVLTAAQGLPFIGRTLLQRNLVKIGIPVVGVPLAVVLNRSTTRLAGRQAQDLFRNEARVIELAGELSGRSRHPGLLLWVAWLVIDADRRMTDDRTLLMKHLVRLVGEQHQVVEDRLARVVAIDPAEVWRRVDAEPGDLGDVVDAAERVAAVDGAPGARAKAVLAELRDRCRRGA